MAKFSVSFYIGVFGDTSLRLVKGIEFVAEPEVDYVLANWETSAEATLAIDDRHVLKSYENSIDLATDASSGTIALYVDADFELDAALLQKYFGDSDPESIDPENFSLKCGDFTFTTVMGATSID